MNPVDEFFKQYDPKKNYEGYIDKLCDKITPNSFIKDSVDLKQEKFLFNMFFKKWMVSAIHNWTAPTHDNKTSPLTLVLCGGQAAGKTTFFRNLLPKELQKYFNQVELKKNDKDSIHNLCTSLLVIDEEFGGMADKDVKAFKEVSDMSVILQRRPYAKIAVSYKRRAILGGTTNERDVLKDPTGNRRIIALDVKSIALIKEDTTNAWIEAYQLYNSNFPWEIYDKITLNQMKQLTQHLYEKTIIEDIFHELYSTVQTPEYPVKRICNLSEIFNSIQLESHLKLSQKELKKVLTKNNLRAKSGAYCKNERGNKSGYLLYTKNVL